ncbi:MAG: SDR family NAD(P)-dependent oxidoreductase [Marivivens sp.]|nr:SDR family NAD(P)-dependent oxidoreductase [Marivivens sp.]
MFDLTGKNALITGASGGIGGAIAKALHGAGATVTLSGTRQGPLDELAAELGDRVHVLTCNLSDAAAVDALPKQAADLMGSVDILINNAGITKDNLFMRMSDDEWSSVLEVNLTSTMRLCKGVIRGMMKARWGRIVNISSIVGATGNPGQANYAASKAGMVGMSKSIAYEVASRGITVNCVAPGFIATAMTDKLTDDQKEKINVQIPAARMGTPEEIAAAVADDASPMRDPQPDADRVKRPEWLVLRLQCPHLGCPPQGTAAGEKRGEFGGYFCPCHNSQFDTSGRIRKGPSPANLPVPKYFFASDDMIVIGKEA